MKKLSINGFKYLTKIEFAAVIVLTVCMITIAVLGIRFIFNPVVRFEGLYLIILIISYEIYVRLLLIGLKRGYAASIDNQNPAVIAQIRYLEKSPFTASLLGKIFLFFAAILSFILILISLFLNL